MILADNKRRLAGFFVIGRRTANGKAIDC